MNRGRTQIRPFGGRPGCLLMILVSVLLTVAVNLLLR